MDSGGRTQAGAEALVMRSATTWCALATFVLTLAGIGWACDGKELLDLGGDAATDGGGYEAAVQETGAGSDGGADGGMSSSEAGGGSGSSSGAAGSSSG